MQFNHYLKFEKLIFNRVYRKKRDFITRVPTVTSLNTVLYNAFQSSSCIIKQDNHAHLLERLLIARHLEINEKTNRNISLDSVSTLRPLTCKMMRLFLPSKFPSPIKRTLKKYNTYMRLFGAKKVIDKSQHIQNKKISFYKTLALTNRLYPSATFINPAWLPFYGTYTATSLSKSRFLLKWRGIAHQKQGASCFCNSAPLARKIARHFERQSKRENCTPYGASCFCNCAPMARNCKRELPTKSMAQNCKRKIREAEQKTMVRQDSYWKKILEQKAIWRQNKTYLGLTCNLTHSLGQFNYNHFNGAIKFLRKRPSFILHLEMLSQNRSTTWNLEEWSFEFLFRSFYNTLRSIILKNSILSSNIETLYYPKEASNLDNLDKAINLLNFEINHTSWWRYNPYQFFSNLKKFKTFKLCTQIQYEFIDFNGQILFLCPSVFFVEQFSNFLLKVPLTFASPFCSTLNFPFASQSEFPRQWRGIAKGKYANFCANGAELQSKRENCAPFIRRLIRRVKSNSDVFLKFQEKKKDLKPKSLRISHSLKSYKALEPGLNYNGLDIKHYAIWRKPMSTPYKIKNCFWTQVTMKGSNIVNSIIQQNSFLLFSYFKNNISLLDENQKTLWGVEDNRSYKLPFALPGVFPRHMARNFPFCSALRNGAQFSAPMAPLASCPPKAWRGNQMPTIDAEIQSRAKGNCPPKAWRGNQIPTIDAEIQSRAKSKCPPKAWRFCLSKWRRIDRQKHGAEIRKAEQKGKLRAIWRGNTKGRAKDHLTRNRKKREKLSISKNIFNKNQTELTNYNLVIAPSKINIRLHLIQIKTIIKESKSQTQEKLIQRLKKKILIWSNLYKSISKWLITGNKEIEKTKELSDLSNSCQTNFLQSGFVQTKYISSSNQYSMNVQLHTKRGVFWKWYTNGAKLKRRRTILSLKKFKAQSSSPFKSITQNRDKICQELKILSSLSHWYTFFRNRSDSLLISDVMKRIFSYCDYITFKCLWKWSCRRHPNKSKAWIKEKYFHTLSQKTWVFGYFKNPNKIFVFLPTHR